MVDAYVELYRSSVICDLLTDTLEELAEENKVTQELAVKVLGSFDKSCLEALTKRAEAKGALSGQLNTYNYFDNVWQFEVTNMTFKLAARQQGAMASAPKITADKVKIICVDAKLCHADAD